MENFFLNQQDSLIELRHHFHRHPELVFKEFNTMKIIIEELEKLNLPYESEIAETVIIAVVKGNLEDNGRRIGLRSDMDALPIHEATQLNYESESPGCMHACGHDGHMTTLIGVTRYLASHRDFSGTIYLIFQPAEEGVGGGKLMVEEGLLDKYPMHEIYALHNWPYLPLGTVGICDGAIMASADKFNIEITGKGGHGGAGAHLTIDPIRISSILVQSLYTIIGREVNPHDIANLSICAIKAGELEAFNIIPDKTYLSGTTRTFDINVRDSIEHAVKRIADGIAKSYNCQIKVNYENIFPTTINDTNAAQRVSKVANALFGKDQLIENVEPSLVSEDFAFMLQHCKGAYFFLGTAEGNCQAPLHSANFDFNDNAIPLGSYLLSKIALDALSQF